jgi:GMP reductase
MIIEDDLKLDYNDVLLRPKRSTLTSRKNVQMHREFKFKHSQKTWNGVPIMAANMDGIGTIEMARELQRADLFTCLHKFYRDVKDLSLKFSETLNPSRVAVSVGANIREFQWFQEVYEASGGKIEFICIDVANGYQEAFVEMVEKYRKTFPKLTIIAGNVATSDMTTELILRGADIVKVGIGPGSVCTTRLKTGVGYPQLSAIIECADAAHGLGGQIIADGGCSTSGDVAKAFGAGADFVMLGGMLSGHKEGGGEVEDGFVVFYGMSSDVANMKHFGGLKDYRASEGRTVKVPYRGEVKNTVQDILGGVRSTCTYVGAKRIKDLPKCTTFVRVNNTHNRIFEKFEIGK